MHPRPTSAWGKAGNKAHRARRNAAPMRAEASGDWVLTKADYRHRLLLHGRSKASGCAVSACCCPADDVSKTTIRRTQ